MATAAHTGGPQKFMAAIAQNRYHLINVFVIEMVMVAPHLPLSDRIFLPLHARHARARDR